jgi:hypothetical protein
MQLNINPRCFFSSCNSANIVTSVGFAAEVMNKQLTGRYLQLFHLGFDGIIQILDQSAPCATTSTFSPRTHAVR